MERAKKALELSENELDRIAGLRVDPHEFQVGPSFYEELALRGIRVERVDFDGFLICTFKVPPRLIDRAGNLATGAIANVIDIVGNAVISQADQPMNVSVTMSISYLSNAKLDDELEITARLLGKIGAVSGTSIIIKKKDSGEIVAEGRHTLFSKVSKI